MSCDICATGEPHPKLVRYNFLDGDRLILIAHVPTEVCDRCVETSFAPDVVERLQKRNWEAVEPLRVIQAPVYECAEA